MKQINLNRQLWKRIVLVAVALAASLFLMYYFYSITFSIVVALIITGLLMPLMRKLQIIGYSKKSSLYLVLIISFLFLVVFGLAFIPYLLSQFTTLTDNAPLIFNKIVSVVEKIDDSVTFVSFEKFYTAETIDAIKSGTMKQLFDISSIIIPLLFNLILVVPILTIIFLMQGENLKKGFISLVPNKYFEPVLAAWNKSIKEISHYIVAKVFESFVIGLVLTVGFYFVGLDGALLFGVLGGVLNIIPYLGPLIGAVPPVLIAIAGENNLVILGVIVVAVIAQLIDNLYIIPIWFSKIMKMHPLLVVVLIFVGAKVMGVLGMVLIYPVFSVLKIFFIEVYRVFDFIYPAKAEG